MQAIILAGGRGTRLKDITGDTPKPLIDIDGRPLIGRQLDLLARSGIRDVLLLTGYGSDAIRRVIGDGRDYGVEVQYLEEQSPLGTAGALLSAYPRMAERAVVAYGDCMLQVDIARMASRHEMEGAAATLLLHPNSHPEDSDLVEIDSKGWISAFHPYPHDPARFYANLVNAAFYILERGALARYLDGFVQPGEKPDIAKHLFPRMVADGTRLLGYRSPEYIKDAGTPARYRTVVRDWQSGRIARLSLAEPQKAIFLDRDGTVNVEVDRVSNPDSLALIEGVGKAVKRINESEYRAIVVTNQPVLARGDCDERTLAAIHAKLDTLLAADGSYLDALYYCPHHPDRGYAGEITALKIACDCRKPAPGLLRAAQVDFNIDLSRSWLIGDTTTDIKTARSAGVRAVLVLTGKAGRDGLYDITPHHTFPTLGEAIDFILAQDAQPTEPLS